MKDLCLVIVVTAAIITILKPVNGWNFWGVTTSNIEQHTKAQVAELGTSMESETLESNEYTVKAQYPIDNGPSTAQYPIDNGPSTAQYPIDNGPSTAQYPIDIGPSTAQYLIDNGVSTAQYPNDGVTSTAQYATDNQATQENTEAIEKFDDNITDIIFENNGSLYIDTSLYDREFDDFPNSTTTSSADLNELKTTEPAKVEDDRRNFFDGLAETLRQAMDMLAQPFSSSDASSSNDNAKNTTTIESLDETENETVINKLCDSTMSGNCSFEENLMGAKNDSVIVNEETNVTENQFITASSVTVSDFVTYRTENQYSTSLISMMPNVQLDTTTEDQHSAKSSPTLFNMETTEDFSEDVWKSPVQDDQLESTWIDAAGSCFVERVKSDTNTDNCMIMKNETLESVLLNIFNSTVIRKLVKRCMPGEWCLRHHPHWKPEPETIHRSCDVLSCLTNRKSNFDCPNLLIIRSAIELMCNLSKAEVSSDCFVSGRMMSHVIVSDVVRKMIQIEEEKSFCSVIEDKEQCSGPCRKVSNDVHCMCASCNQNMNLFQGIDEWQWFLNLKDSSEKCELNSTDCSLFEVHSSIKSKDSSRHPQHEAHQLVKILLNNEWHLVAGLSLSVVFSLLVVSSIFIALRCHRNRRLRRRLMKQNALMGNDKTFHDDRYARDKVQYTIINTHPDDEDDEES